MTGLQSSGLAPGFYVSRFGELLTEQRQSARLSVRAVAKAIARHHSGVVRAEQGRAQPTWDLTRDYLRACGVGTGLLIWSSLWTITRQAEQERKRRPYPQTSAEIRFWRHLETGWLDASAQLEWPNSLVAKLRLVDTQRDLGLALLELGGRTKRTSVRAIEACSGIPRTTLHEWITGRRAPDAVRLEKLVKALDASRDEWDEFLSALERVTGAECTEVHRPTRGRCTQSEFHKGPHTTLQGDTWLDDGEPGWLR